MARLDLMPEPMRFHLEKLPCPSFDKHPWVSGPALSKRRVAIIYSFMGATDPAAMESGIRDIAGFLKGDRVDAALLVPV